jgi:hypothetical protein
MIDPNYFVSTAEYLLSRQRIKDQTSQDAGNSTIALVEVKGTYPKSLISHEEIIESLTDTLKYQKKLSAYENEFQIQYDKRQQEANLIREAAKSLAAMTKSRDYYEKHYKELRQISREVISDLQTQITSGGGYFILTCEFNGNSTNSGFFGFGAGVNSSALEVVLPNCSCIAYRAECTSAVAAAGTIVFQKNGTAVNALDITYDIGDTLVQDLNRNTAFVLGDTISIRFNSTGSSMGGTLWRVNYIFQTNAVNGTNGSNGSNGQNVSFYTPTITTITPVTASSISVKYQKVIITDLLEEVLMVIIVVVAEVVEV